MTPDVAADAVSTVRAFWHGLSLRDWAGARALLRDDATMHWVTSGEHYDDADAIIRVQVLYPEGWVLRVLNVDALADGRVHSVVEVCQDGRRYYANSRFCLEGGRIRQITEHWATWEAPPAWRTAERLGAYHRDEDAA
ncbi:MAG: hypothetical protein L6Q75_13910 [Burkholderiaceae bacterium]|nr:hypothetical protein [Burkholderiaceae bacterium]